MRAAIALISIATLLACARAATSSGSVPLAPPERLYPDSGPGYVDYLDSWCNGYRYVPAPAIRAATSKGQDAVGVGRIAIVAQDEFGYVGIEPLHGTQTRLARDSLFASVVVTQVVTDSTSTELSAPAGSYWLSLRRIGYLPLLAPVTLRAGMIDTVTLPVVRQRMC